MKNILILLYLITLHGSSMAQNAQEVLQKIRERYTSNKDYHYEMKYDFYVEGAAKSVQTVDAKVQQYQGRVYVKFDAIEQVSNSKVVVTLNREEKYIISDLPSNLEQPAAKMGFQQILDDISAKGQQLYVQTDKDGKQTLFIHEAKEASPSWVIGYNTVDYSVAGLTIHFNAEETAVLYGEEAKSSRMEVQVKTLPITEPKLKVESVVAEKDGKYQLKPAFKGFEHFDRTK